jgi:hypothetical protein
VEFVRLYWPIIATMVTGIIGYVIGYATLWAEFRALKGKVTEMNVFWQKISKLETAREVQEKVNHNLSDQMNRIEKKIDDQDKKIDTLTELMIRASK